MSGLQDASSPRVDPGRFVDIEAKPVSGAVEKPLHSAVDQPRRKAAVVEVGQDFLMNGIRIGAASDTPESDLLSFFDASVGGFQPFRSFAAHNCARDVSKESALLRARKDI